MRASRPPRADRGQVLIPALLVLPALFLFVFFIIEVGRLSRDKIRNQFALDISATLEMEQYTDLVNRLAYVNGVFPERIFKEAYGPNWSEYYSNGLFPGSPQGGITEDDPQWGIRFGAGRQYANVPDPPTDFGVLHMHLPGGGILTLDQATKVATNYIMVYRWLGDVATAHKLVFDKMTQDRHALLRKSLWMNSGAVGANDACAGPDSCGDEAASGFGDINVRMHYVSGFKHCPTITVVNGQKYVGELAGSFGFQGSGLFQLATVPSADLDLMQKGYVIRQPWIPRRNFFGVDSGGLVGGAFVRARVTSTGGRVWPETTPKYYTRLYP